MTKRQKELMYKLDSPKKRHVVRVYFRYYGNVKKVCRKAGISRQTFYDWLRDPLFSESIGYKKNLQNPSSHPKQNFIDIQRALSDKSDTHKKTEIVDFGSSTLVTKIHQNPTYAASGESKILITPSTEQLGKVSNPVSIDPRIRIDQMKRASLLVRENQIYLDQQPQFVTKKKDNWGIGGE